MVMFEAEVKLFQHLSRNKSIVLSHWILQKYGLVKLPKFSLLLVSGIEKPKQVGNMPEIRKSSAWKR